MTTSTQNSNPVSHQEDQETEKSTDTSEEDQEQDNFQTALDTVINHPTLSCYATAIQEIQSTQPLNLDVDTETGMGRLNSVIRELFGRDTMEAALLERALLNWIKFESRRQSHQQMAWYKQFHPGTRTHTAYGEIDDRADPPFDLPRHEMAAPRMRTAAGGGGDPNDPGDDPCPMVIHELHKVATTQKSNHIITKSICQLHLSNHWISAVGKIAAL